MDSASKKHHTNRKPRIIVIVGPTASGKSALAVRVAKTIGGEIISADSRQIYRGLDIGTAKITKKEMRGIPHYLLDIASPKRAVTATKFKRLAEKKIQEIIKRNRTPVIVGGTGFWIDTLVYNLTIPEVSPNLSLRKMLEKKSLAQLVALLKRLDPARLQSIDQNNPRRLIRAIEIAKKIGTVPPLEKHMSYDAYWIGIRPSSSKLLAHISARATHMIRKGLLREIKQLRAHHISKKRINELGFEYQLALAYQEHKINRTQLHHQLIRATVQYAKRQMTWWKKNTDIHWISDPHLFNLVTIPMK